MRQNTILSRVPEYPTGPRPVRRSPAPKTASQSAASQPPRASASPTVPVRPLSFALARPPALTPGAASGASHSPMELPCGPTCPGPRRALERRDALGRIQVFYQVVVATLDCIEARRRKPAPRARATLVALPGLGRMQARRRADAARDAMKARRSKPARQADANLVGMPAFGRMQVRRELAAPGRTQAAWARPWRGRGSAEGYEWLVGAP